MSSYKDLKPSQVKDTPFVNIGAQDLITVEANWKGLVRKEGQLERGLKKLGPLASLQWRQYFVVLSQGCVYVFHDDHSASPKVHFSLMNYHKLRRNFSIPHCFEILPCSSEGKLYKFSCATDTERLEWMRAIYVSMLVVHEESLPDDEHTKLKKSDEYNLLESTVVGASASSTKLYEINDDDDESSDDNYDKPDESLVKSNKYEPDPTTKCVSTTGTIPKQPKSKRIQKSVSEQRETYEDAASPPNDTTKQRSFSEGTVNFNGGNTSVDAVDSTSMQTKTKPKPKVAPKPAKPGMYINSLNPPISSLPRTKSPTSQLRMTTPASRSRTNSPATNLRITLPSPSRTESPSSEVNFPVSSDSSSRPSSKESDKQSKSQEPKLPTPRKSPQSSAELSNSSGTNYLNMTTEEAGYVQPDPRLDPASEYLFGGNRDDSARELELLAERTFLVRDSSEPGKKVLVVKTKAGLKSYKIEKNSDKFMIETNLTFSTLHEVLEYYKRHNLPNIGMTLRLGYNAKQSSAPDDDDYEPVGQPLC
ncbi:uncharacterized protein LOC134716395 isoform X1 [Mytilus trossulus]|uniref:uncharacterized protein LOC134716395 isoform X1 n=2 Tax=Mytilus trossulus TaxID=6551 RepID=UPI003006F3E3